MTVGDRIRELRIKLGIQQIELAEKCGISKQTLYKYENNIVTNIPSDKLELMAKYLNTSPAYLMGWEETSTIDTDLVVDVMFNTKVMEYLDKLMRLSESGQQTIFDNIDFLLKKEGRD